jgi:hypothetical protein
MAASTILQVHVDAINRGRKLCAAWAIFWNVAPEPKQETPEEFHVPG